MTIERLLFTRAEAAEIFGISTRTLCTWIRHRELEEIRIKGISRISRDEIDRLIRKHGRNNNVSNNHNK